MPAPSSLTICQRQLLSLDLPHCDVSILVHRHTKHPVYLVWQLFLAAIKCSWKFFAFVELQQRKLAAFVILGHWSLGRCTLGRQLEFDVCLCLSVCLSVCARPSEPTNMRHMLAKSPSATQCSCHCPRCVLH